MNERILAGRYRILAAVGGRSDLFHAEDESLCRKVAVMHLAENVTPETRPAWEQEIAKAAGLHDPHLLSIYDVVIEEPNLYLITEDFEGTILSRWLRERAPLKPEAAVALMHQLVGAVVAAERAGITEITITPNYVLVTKEGFLKAIGYGPLIGPQDQGRSHAELVHTMGVLLYEMLTGEPYSDLLPTQQLLGDVRSALGRADFQEHLWLPDRLLTILDRILAKSARGPFQSVQELYKELKGIHHALSQPVLSRVEARQAQKAKPEMVASVGSTQALGRMKDSVKSLKDKAQAARKMAEETIKPPKRTPVTFIGVVLAVMLIGAGAWWMFGGETSTATTAPGQAQVGKAFKMPNLLNKTEEQAVQILGENGYPTDQIQWVYRSADDNATKGKVYRQSVDPNTEVVTTDLVVLTVNSDSTTGTLPGRSNNGNGSNATPQPQVEEGIVPDLTGLSQAQAEQLLLSAGYRYSFEISAGSTPSGTVYNQTPTAGSSLQKGERVTFQVSQ